jgi:hypothetical protein
MSDSIEDPEAGPESLGNVGEKIARDAVFLLILSRRTPARW